MGNSKQIHHHHIFIVFYFVIQFAVLISCDVCSINAICNCVVNNHTTVNSSHPNPVISPSADSSKLMLNNVQINQQIDDLNLCNFQNVSKIVTKYILNCSHVDVSNSSSPHPIQTNSFTLLLNYECDAPKPPTPPPNGYSMGSVLVIIFFTIVFSYLGLGICVNFFLIGARGIEMLPHLDFWKDFPSLVLDGVKFLQNGCNARPSDLTAPAGTEGYDAI